MGNRAPSTTSQSVSFFLQIGLLLAVASGCSTSLPPIPIHESPGLTVQLTYDPQAGTGHNHPTTVSPADLAAVLSGLRLKGRDVAGGLGLFSDDRGTPVFTNRQAATLAPFMSTGLAKASSRDVVTFYLVQGDVQERPLVTSGGLFVRNGHLYVIVANARTSPTAVQYETPYEPNSRLNPLLPIARYKFVLDFTPTEWRVGTAEAKRTDQWVGYLDESKVVVIDETKIRP